MEAPSPTQSESFGNSTPSPFRGLFTDAVRFWELRRLFYNLALAAVVVIWLVATWPHFRPAFTLTSLLLLSVLALIANAFYCAAYLVDIPMQCSSFNSTWKRRRWAWWLIGTLFAILLANYWIADEIYPFVR
jgi:hypothetical protein